MVAEKKIKIASLTSKEDIKRRINFLESNGIKFKMKLSTYTTTIETPSSIYKWNDNNMNSKAFIGYQLIKRDLKEYTANEMPDINRNNLEFFNTYIEGNINENTAFCIDIKSAYATILFIDGFISERTFAYISSLPKKARLACVGMLASRHDLFYFEGENLISHDKVVNPLENYFWYCVQRTSEIMLKIVGETRALFYWVDGIYFTDYESVIKAKKILEEEKFNFSEKNCLMFSATTKETKNGNSLNSISFYESKNLNLQYSQATKENTEYKVFSIPLRRNLKNQLINYLINKK